MSHPYIRINNALEINPRSLSCHLLIINMQISSVILYGDFQLFFNCGFLFLKQKFSKLTVTIAAIML